MHYDTFVVHSKLCSSICGQFKFPSERILSSISKLIRTRTRLGDPQGAPQDHSCQHSLWEKTEIPGEIKLMTFGRALTNSFYESIVKIELTTTEG